MVDNVEWDGRLKGPKDLGSASVGSAWGAIGSAFKAGGVDKLKAWIDLTINDANNVRVRAVGKLTAGGSAYPLSVHSAGTAPVQAVEDDYYEFGADEDQFRGLHFDVRGATPYIELQTQAGTEGGTAAIMKVQVTTS